MCTIQFGLSSWEIAIWTAILSITCERPRIGRGSISKALRRRNRGRFSHEYVASWWNKLITFSIRNRKRMRVEYHFGSWKFKYINRMNDECLLFVISDFLKINNKIGSLWQQEKPWWNRRRDSERTWLPGLDSLSREPCSQNLENFGLLWPHVLQASYE
jgi:hypothetical protein